MNRRMALIDMRPLAGEEYCKEIGFLGLQQIDRDRKAALYTKLDQKTLLDG